MDNNEEKIITYVNGGTNIDASSGKIITTKQFLTLSDISSLPPAKVYEALANINNLDRLNKQLEIQKGRDNNATNLIFELSQKNQNISKINEIKQALRKDEQVLYLIPRVHEDAQQLLLDNSPLRNKFENTKECETVVMSIDIRRSTELMLKAKTPQEYANFITDLCRGIKSIVIDNYGIYDKFTGDGVIAFFPYFYSGPDMIGHSLKAANEIHACFDEHYKTNRNSFTTILKDVGLGIGIDVGKAHLTSIIDSDYTIVGQSVVYACRLSGAKAGDTLLNQSAMEMTTEKYKTLFELEETELEIKREGSILAYRVKSTSEIINFEKPEWVSSIKKN